jgi:hypothetical protein
MMTRKHYKMIASAISKTNISQAGKDEVVVKMVKTLKEDNPRFDAHKFAFASGMSVENIRKEYE